MGANRKRLRELGPIAVACLFVGYEIGIIALLLFERGAAAGRIAARSDPGTDSRAADRRAAARRAAGLDARAVSSSQREVDLQDARRLAGHRVLVVGDLVLDEYVTGRPARVSREAPVLILDVVEREERAGSAASPAANVIALGSHATVVGVVGCDPAGARLEDALRRLGVDDRGLVRWPDAVTPTKTRILAQGFTGGLYGRQQVLRLDNTSQLPVLAAAACAERVSQLAAGLRRDSAV